MDRKNRTHVITVRCRKDTYYVILSDDPEDINQFEILWDNWINMSEKERHTA